MVITNSNLDSSLFTVELSQVAERESVRRGSLKALRDRWEDLSRLCRVCLLDGHTLRLTPPAGVTSSTTSLAAQRPLKYLLRATARASAPCASASLTPSSGLPASSGRAMPTWNLTLRPPEAPHPLHCHRLCPPHPPQATPRLPPHPAP